MESDTVKPTLNRGLHNIRTDLPLEFGPQEMFEMRAAETPSSPAVVMDGAQLSYSELNERANRLGHFLRSQGVAPGRIVGVLLDRSVEMVICLLGILKAGAVYLPLDPKFPKDRLAFMLSDADVSILFTQAALQADLPPSQGKVFVVEDLAEILTAFSSSNPVSVNSPDDLAYLIYTSGSTGKPKGVMVPRRALVNFLLSMAEQPGMCKTDVLLAVTTISFDISLLEMLLPLAAGAKIVVATRPQAADPFQLRELLEAQHITVMQATPTTWRLLLESGWKGKSNLKILCGGEALTQDIAERLLPRCAELWNMYGPTETTIWSSTQHLVSAQNITLGSPIANTQLVVVDEQMQPVPPGGTGELLIGGIGLALGYLKREELTAQKFIPNPISGSNDARLYRTGDEVRFRSDGNIEFIGRLDHQIKLNGFRIELGEIEAALSRIEGIHQSVVILREDTPGDKRLVAYFTGNQNVDTHAMLVTLRASLPEYMLPAACVRMPEFPQTPNNKLDRKALPAPARTRPLLAQQYVAPSTEIEKELADVWQELLKVDAIGIDDSFFDLGGNSITVFRMVSACRSRLGRDIPPVKVFQYPTVAQLSRFLEGGESDISLFSDAEARVARLRGQGSTPSNREAVAIVGMSGRFPGADDLEQFWRNLCAGRESISFFTPEELGPGVEERLRNAPDYVRARGIIEGAEMFDAGFFGISPLEARVTDPQQRIFLELAFNALESAGCDPARYKGLIGVYAGIGDNHYYTTNLLTHPDLLARAGKLAVEYGNEKDYIALRTAYLLDLRGPAVSLNTACSTTLLAVDLAYRALLGYECDMALAGGIDIGVPQKSGFVYTEGGTFTSDGHCRPFDADASGTMFCDGAGVVVLKRLSDALRDGDTIFAVIEGSGKNNNGSRPASFLAPSVEGQAEAVAMAQAVAGIDVEDIGYIEAHGTGTPVGDPIEIQALTSVFRRKTQKKQFCFIGSLKGNIGHPTNAAGVAGLIKAALVLHKEQIPATLHYRNPNPRINFADSPFIVADHLIPFPRSERPRHTAVSSFGFGGTNVHIILGEAPPPASPRGARPLQLLPISARTAPALDALSASLARHFQSAPEDTLADAAFTLQTGRRQMAMRRFVVAGSSAEAAQLFLQPNPRRSATMRCERRDPPIAFLFGGQGTQYVNMGQNLYAGEPLFRAVVDDCCEILKPHLGRDLRELLYPKSGDNETAQISLQDTFFTQPSLFVIEYALARFWESLGIRPAIMVGHSIGEFVAATLANVWDLEDALRIVALRGRLMQSLPRGSMMAVRAGVETVARMLPPDVQIASNNAPKLCVVSGPDAVVQSLRTQLEADNIACRPLHTSHAFHSAMMDPMVEPLRNEIAKVRLRVPVRPFISTVTGQLITDAEATSPEYWASQARATVEFSKAALTLKELGYDLFLECGPRSTLCALARQHYAPTEACIAIPTLSDTHEDNQEWASVLIAIGSLWGNGVTVDWDAFYANEDRRRIPLPVYPFDRQRYWIDPVEASPAAPAPRPASHYELQPQAVVSSQAPQPAAAASRKERISVRLIELIAPISGHEASQLSVSTLFLEQGFDSLALAQVSVEIENEFGVKIGFSKLMNQFPTVEMVAAHLDATLPPEVFPTPSSAPIASAPPSAHTPASQVFAGVPDPTVQALISAVAEQGRILTAIQETIAKITKGTNPPERPVLPEVVPAPPVKSVTTLAQRGIFYSSSISENLSASYNESITLKISGQVDVPHIRRALERLVERHDALRASFDPSGAEMRISSAFRLDVTMHDLSALGAEEREQRLRQLGHDEAARPFALHSGRFVRASIVLLGPQEAAVVLTLHHIICDGWSVDVLVQDFCTFYSRELSGQQESLLPAPSFAAYAHMTDVRAHSQEFEQARAYWARKFANAVPALALPADFPRKPVREHRATRVDRLISTQLVEQVRAVAAEQGCSLFAVNVATLSILLARLSGQTRFILTLSIAEQPFLGQTQLVGHCVSLMPFLVELHPGEGVLALTRRVQQELAEAMDHLSFTTVNLMEELVPSSRTRLSPIPVGLTGIKKFRPDELDQRGFSLDYASNPKSFESFEWYMSAVESSEGLELHSHHDVELFSQATIERWLADFEEILGEIAAQPVKSAFELAGLSEGSAVAPMRGIALHSASDSAQASSLTSALFLQVEDQPFALNWTIGDKLLSSPSDASAIAAAYVAPRDAMEQLLEQIWAKVLNAHKIGVQDNFFQLGGHSLLAVRLMSEVEKHWNIRLPLATLLQAPTIAAMAGVLRTDRSAPSWSPLVPIHPDGSKLPLFFMHSHGGNTLEYQALGSLLGKDQPVFALQARGLDGHIRVGATIEEMASAYVSEIRSFRPQGPYLLGGFCFGGLLALEAAHQLKSIGEDVPLLVLIQASHPRAMNFRADVRAPQRIWYRAKKRFDLELENFTVRGAQYLRDRSRYTLEQLGAKVAFGVGWIDATRNPDLSRRRAHYIIEALGIEHSKAASKYEPPVYDGNVILFRAKEQLCGLDSDEYLGWKETLQGNIKIIEIPGHQQNMLTLPHVVELANQLTKSMADVMQPCEG